MALLSGLIALMIRSFTTDDNCYSWFVNYSLVLHPASQMTKMYRVQVETNDGCVTSWYEQSRAKDACNMILERVYQQLCGLNIKEVSVTPSV